MPNVISYSQNQEDVVLWRVFKDLKNGCYIDVGACDPEKDSDTKMLYDNGWNGINIEPEKVYFEKLAKHRPKDINLNLAVDEFEGDKLFYVSNTRGWSTLDKSRAEQVDFNSSQIFSVKCVPLNNLIEKYCKKKINFLKIDVEGNELSILKSFDFKKYHPEIIMVEEQLQYTNDTYKKDKLSELILKNGYHKCQFNGVNSIYISIKAPYDKSLLSFPANALDNYDEYKKLELLKTINDLKNNNTQSLELVKNLREQNKTLEKKINELTNKKNFFARYFK